MTTIPTLFCTVFAKIHQNCLKGFSIHIRQLLYPLNHPVHRTGHTPSVQFAVPWLCGLSTSIRSSYSYFKNTNMVRKKQQKINSLYWNWREISYLVFKRSCKNNHFHQHSFLMLPSSGSLKIATNCTS